MGTKNIKENINEFKSLINVSISKYKPIRARMEGSIDGLASYLKSYDSKLCDCIKELTHKGNTILKQFKEEKEGDARVLKDIFLKEIHEVAGKFKKKYWN